MWRCGVSFLVAVSDKHAWHSSFFPPTRLSLSNFFPSSFFSFKAPLYFPSFTAVTFFFQSSPFPSKKNSFYIYFSVKNWIWVAAVFSFFFFWISGKSRIFYIFVYLGYFLFFIFWLLLSFLFRFVEFDKRNGHMGCF